ncbi:motile sperm domain-containing protein 1 [Aethina tumida]|uniref:motile sperm domain-containing protein 1 n=1 Tax=Aethina tumida TaxID=116153 RepID=UPI00096B4ABB|nr:motile sperm domain-containing protein 1 [Aethina tumida]
MSVHAENIPVFVFPNTLKFYLLSRETHKQLLTLYNPSDTALRFRVLCTAPNKYQVMDSEGTVGPSSSVDIIVKYIMPSQSACNQVDKFRISLLSYGTKQTLGKKIIESTLIYGEKDRDVNEKEVPGHQQGDRPNYYDDQRSLYSGTSYGSRNEAPTNKAVIVFCTIVCLMAICILFLPTYYPEVKEPSSLPLPFHISVGVKIVISFVLGLGLGVFVKWKAS